MGFDLNDFYYWTSTGRGMQYSVGNHTDLQKWHTSLLVQILWGQAIWQIGLYHIWYRLMDYLVALSLTGDHYLHQHFGNRSWRPWGPYKTSVPLSTPRQIDKWNKPMQSWNSIYEYTITMNKITGNSYC
jgi:hypothetical protein